MSIFFQTFMGQRFSVKVDADTKTAELLESIADILKVSVDQVRLTLSQQLKGESHLAYRANASEVDTKILAQFKKNIVGFIKDTGAPIVFIADDMKRRFTHLDNLLPE